MRRRADKLALIVLLLTCVVGWSAAFAAKTPKTPKRAKEKPKEIVAAMEQQWRTAIMASDSAALDKLLSDDYVGISWTGDVTTKAGTLERLQNRKLVLTRLDLDEPKIKVVGPVAIVTSVAHLEGESDGKDMHGMYRYTRIYQRLPSGNWRITNFEATRIPSPEERQERQDRSPRKKPAL